MIVGEERLHVAPRGEDAAPGMVGAAQPAYRRVARLGLLVAASAPLWVLAPEGFGAVGFIGPFVAVPLVAVVVWHRGAWGRVLGVLTGLGLLAAVAPFAAEALEHPDSFFDFFPVASLLLGALLAACGSVASLVHHGRGATRAPGEGAITVAALVALVALAGVSGVLTVSGRHTVSALDRFGAKPVAMVGFEFEPAALTGEEGRRARFVVRNDDLALHTFTIDEFGVDAVVKPGSEVLVEFRPDRAGTYLLYCRPHTQDGQGMVGTFNVE